MVNSMKSRYTSLIIGGIVVLVTILIALVVFSSEKDAIDYTALLFILIAECIYFGLTYLYKNSTTFSKLTMIPVITIYSIASILFSLVFRDVFRNNIAGFVVLHIVLIAVCAIAILLIGNFIPKIEKEEEKTIAQMAVINECESKALILTQTERFSQHKDILTKIYEEIKFSDHVSECKSSEILLALNRISNSTADDNLDDLCQYALELVKERNTIVKQLKRGGF